MPQTKKQEIVYTVMMVCVMVYGMVCYNIALDVGGMQNFIFAAALSELPIMGVIGFLLDTFLVGPTAMRIATGWFTPGEDKQVFLVVAISCLSAAMNYPSAFLWQRCGAGPLVRFVFGKGLAAMKKK